MDAAITTIYLPCYGLHEIENETIPTQAPCTIIPLAHMVISLIFFLFVITLGTVGNGLLLFVFMSSQNLFKKSIHIFICSKTVVNFLISVIIDPIVASRNFIQCPERLRYMFSIAYFFLQLCAVSSILTLTVVAANRYLLISRPFTAYRTCCTGRKAISLFMVGIWVLALVVVWLLWLVIMWNMYYDDNPTVENVLQIVFILPGIFIYVPMIVIPIFHFMSIYHIRRSRNRVSLDRKIPSSASLATSNFAWKRPGPSGSSSSPTLQRYSQRSEDFGSATDSISKSGNWVIAGDVSSNSTPATNETTLQIEGVSGTPASTRSVWTGACTRRETRAAGGVGRVNVSTTHSTMTSVQSEQRTAPAGVPRRTGSKSGEIRLIKMMMAMYVVLAVSWSPSLLYFVVKNTGSSEQFYYYLHLFGFIIPIYPSLIPFVVLFSNKLYRNIALKKMSKIRIRRKLNLQD